MQAKVVATCKKKGHHFSKDPQTSIHLLEDLGVEGDAHAGKTVKHRSRVVKDPTQPNLRQVHLIHIELHQELNKKGFSTSPGDMGENITTEGIDLLSLPQGTKLKLGQKAVIEITGLRNPCPQLNNFQMGLTEAVLERNPEGKLIRKSGVMAIVLCGGIVSPGDIIQVELPLPPHKPLERV